MQQMDRHVTGKTILHLTDLHFGWDADPTKLAERTLALDSLREEAVRLEPEWRPDILCVSGDIGWRGSAPDYEAAEAWLRTLLDRLGLTFGDVLVCAGNHDVSRAAARTVSRPGASVEADEVLSVPIARHYLDPFAAFSDFCERAGVRPYTFHGAPSYLVGETVHKGIRFVACNSAWFCKGDDDKNKLWVGLPHLKVLAAEGRLPLRDSARPPTVALVHHPPDWWHENETHADALRLNALDYLAHRCDVLLSGHTHAEVRKANRIAEEALHLTGGSTYAGADHFNTFRLVRVKGDRLVYRSFEFDPRSPEAKWSDRWGAQSLPFVERPPETAQVAAAVPSFDLSRLRAAAADDARRIIETKSRQLKLAGTLPPTLPLRVEVRVTSQTDHYDPQGQLAIASQQTVSVPLYEACRMSRRTVLLGDLGSGKSTLAAHFVLDTLESDPHVLAVLLPAKALRLPEEFRLAELLTACGEYLASHVAPWAGPCDLPTLLAAGVEVCLAIDGLDEVPRQRAGRLLRLLIALVDAWPNAQILVTGRPVELAGTSYERWGLCRIGRLSEQEKGALFKEEALAGGCAPEEAPDVAQRCLAMLKRQPALDELASTPLAARLLYPKLATPAAESAMSTADLLDELLAGRLGGWSERELKTTPYERFEAVAPTPVARAEILGELALCIAAPGRIGRAQAEHVLREAVGGDSLAAQQALGFFEHAGLLSVEGEVEFVFQPFLETAAAVALLARWLGGPAAAMPAVAWRVVAFAAAAARRRGVIDRARTHLQATIEDLLHGSVGVPAACVVASESRDAELARSVLRGFRGLGRRPLYGFREERFVTSHAIARVLHLAGPEGFDWFYEQYLDPRYPIVHRGSAVVEEVLHHWAWLSRASLTPGQRDKLRPLIRPLLVSTGLVLSMLPTLAILLPAEFDESQRFWFLSAFLEDQLFGEEATRLLTQGCTGAARPLVAEILCRRAEHSRKAAWLFASLFPGERFPARIARALMRWHALVPEDRSVAAAVEACATVAGDTAWLRFVRWCLSDPDHGVVGGAAVLLHERGEAPLVTLGEPLLHALHDGGYVRSAEGILSELVARAGPQGLQWLVSHMAHRQGLDGGHSGWWRILLHHLDPEAAESPDLLARAVAAVGPYLLPRYPEVRDGLNRLLSGPTGERFRATLSRRLVDLDPRIRHGAASVLITHDPRGEAQALTVLVGMRDDFDRFDHEWDPFCLSLSFGPTVLEHLHSRLGTFDKEGRAFALALLRRHLYRLTSAEEEELFGHLLGRRGWSLEGEGGERTAFESEEGYRYLLRQLDAPAGERSGRAAGRLLERFQSRLSPQQEAKCWGHSCMLRLYNPEVLQQQVRRVLEDDAYRDRVRGTFEEAARHLGHPSLLEHAAGAATDPERWRDVVWALLCEDRGIGMEVEDRGQVLLDLGRDRSHDAPAIGRAARALLDDPRVTSSASPEVRQWLALLAHEFARLPAKEVRKALTCGAPISFAAARALLGRLGSLPADMPRRQYPSDYPDDLRDAAAVAPPREPSRALLEYARPADALHPDTCPAVEDLLYAGEIVEEDLRSIARAGSSGILIAETIRFCAGLPARLDDRVPLVLRPPPYAWGTDRCFQRLRWNLRTAHQVALEEDSSAREGYVRLLDERIAGDEEYVAALGQELLRFRGDLRADQVRAVFEDFVHRAGVYRQDLAGPLAEWLATVEGGETARSVAEGAEHAINLLVQRGQPRGAVNEAAYPYLLFPLALWALRGHCPDESVRMYWLGVRLAFRAFSAEQGARHSLEVLEDVSPLARRVPQPIWDIVRHAGASSEDPTVRTLVQLLGGLTGRVQPPSPSGARSDSE